MASPSSAKDPSLSTGITTDEAHRRPLWSSRPSLWVIVSSLCDVLIVVALAVLGIGMTALPLAATAMTLAAAVVFAFGLDLIKMPVFRHLKVS